jgi:Galactose-3-O-sulfotransferase
LNAPTAPLIVFVHVPKTGGMTLDSILARRLRPISADSMDEAKSLIESLPEFELGQVELLSGHVPYGVHAFFHRPAKYVTMLREPVRRVVSHYWFVRNDPDHYLYRAVIDDKLTLRDYADRGCRLSAEIENGQVWMFSERARRLECADRQSLEEAKGVLRDEFAVVGTTERFDESVVCMQHVLGLKRPVYVRRNIGPGPRGLLDEETRAAIKAHNRLDAELYAWANELLDAQIRRIGPRFRQDLARFRRLNAAYAAVHRVAAPLARLAFERRLTLA